jgi:osmoprotectant transport system ATP-binding protein
VTTPEGERGRTAAGTPAGRAATVEFDRVTKHYDRRELKRGAPGAVNELSLVVPEGKICVLVGPSGCGKTTTLKMVNRLIEPTTGRILIDGADAAQRDVTDLRRSIGYVIQQTGLFPHQTIEENVATVPRLLGWPAARRSERAAELLALVGLDPATYAGRFPAQLSGGERQRVGVARALAADPPIMLMDEPFGAVDPIVRGRLQDELLRLQETLAKTILFVTHDIDEAIKMGDLVVVLAQGGRIAQAGAPADLLAAPASDEVARFVGADRGLKRLSLHRVAEIPLEQPVAVHVGHTADEARSIAAREGAAYLLLLDRDDHPLGWLATQDIPATGSLREADADPSSPFFDRRTTLRDAASMLLDSEVTTGIAVDRRGHLLGTLSLDGIMAWLSDDRSRVVPADVAAAVERAMTSSRPQADPDAQSPDETPDS